MILNSRSPIKKLSTFWLQLSSSAEIVYNKNYVFKTKF